MRQKFFIDTHKAATAPVILALMAWGNAWDNPTAWLYLAQYWAPLLVIARVVGAVWIPNMLKKDRSLSRYPEFAEYRSRSWLFLPPIW